MPCPLRRAAVAIGVSSLLLPALLVAQATVTTQHDDDVTVAVNPAPVIGSGTGVLGEYFNDPDNGSHFVSYVGGRLDSRINFDWTTAAPAAGVTSDNFSVRWTGRVQPPVSGSYTFTTVADDGVRVWVNGQLLVDHWVDQAATARASAPVTLTGGSLYDVKMEYYEHAGSASARLQWSYAGHTQAAIPQSQLYPPGNRAPVRTAGNDSRDRTR
jgi:hypothetical protein